MISTQSSPSTQHRHYIEAEIKIARRINDILDAEFEEDGIAVSLFEINEAKLIWCASIYVPAEESSEFRLRMQTAMADNGIDVEIKREIILPTDWVAKTLRQLSPVHAGRFLVHGSHDRGIAKFSDTAIEIDAGQAFGTGHHGTTAGCLEMLGQQLKRRKFFNPLDLGTGSGVLAIAVAKACKQYVLASDIDPIAIQIARQNARLNNAGKWITCVTATGFNHRDITARKPYDLIIANILARPLQDMAKDLSYHLAPHGIVILSGLLPHQKARIIAAFQIQKLRFVKTHIRDGWLTLVLSK